MSPVEVNRYVLGFAFDSKGRDVMLIQKQHPEWMHGQFNGLGGKITKGELSTKAMEREFDEESGLQNPNWTHFCTLSGEDYTLDCYCAFDDLIHAALEPGFVSPTDEKIKVVPVELLQAFPLVSNVIWLVPMALSFLKNKGVVGFEVEEYCA